MQNPICYVSVCTAYFQQNKITYLNFEFSPLGLGDSAVYSAALCLKIDGMTFVGTLKNILGRKKQNSNATFTIYII